MTPSAARAAAFGRATHLFLSCDSAGFVKGPCGKPGSHLRAGLSAIELATAPNRTNRLAGAIQRVGAVLEKALSDHL